MAHIEFDSRDAVRARLPGPESKLLLLVALAAAPAAVTLLAFPALPAMPLASLLSLCAALVTALFAYRYRVDYRSRKLTYWDLAGMLALIGFGTGALTDPNDVLQLFGMNPTN